MMDMKSVGRLTYLSPVTWKDGWPYFGVEGNLGRSPRTWFKPDTGVEESPHAPYERSDDFSDNSLKPVWQWNHIPVDNRWELAKGVLRLHTLPAKSLMFARNTLTQRVVGPESMATVELDARGLKKGDVAGLALLNTPYYWVGVTRTDEGLMLRFYDMVKNVHTDKPLESAKVWLRAHGDYHNDLASLSYSTDGDTFETIGNQLRLGYQMHTFQGVRYALFAYNTEGKKGGRADFDNFEVYEPFADRSKNLPVGKIITLTNLANGERAWANPHGMLHHVAPGSAEFEGLGCHFRVHDRGKGRVALEAMDGSGFLTVTGLGLSGDVRITKEETEASLFLWQDMLWGHCMLLSLHTNRFVGLNPVTGEPYAADWPGTRPDRKDGTVFAWQVVADVAD